MSQKQEAQEGSPARILEADALALLGTLCWELLLRLDTCSVPSSLKDDPLVGSPQSSFTPDYSQLGTRVRDHYLCIELHEDRGLLSLREGRLFWEAIAEGISQLHSQCLMRTRLMSEDQLQAESPPLGVPSVEEIAQAVIEEAYFDEDSEPTPAEQKARARFALELDPLCADAYFIRGYLEDRHGRFHLARVAYERAMRVSAFTIGPEVFRSKEVRQARDIVFWEDRSTRPYMRARSALAHLLWRHLGDLRLAIAHFQALLDLDANDHQGNRYALMCCLLESGDHEQISGLLARERFFTGQSGLTEEITDTCWHYSRALQLYQAARQTSGNEKTLEPAIAALQTAFADNPFVPSYLLAWGESPRVPAHLRFGNDVNRETARRRAVWYADLARRTWGCIPGALQWLEGQADLVRLLAGQG